MNSARRKFIGPTFCWCLTGAICCDSTDWNIFTGDNLSAVGCSLVKKEGFVSVKKGIH